MSAAETMTGSRDHCARLLRQAARDDQQLAGRPATGRQPARCYTDSRVHNNSNHSRVRYTKMVEEGEIVEALAQLLHHLPRILLEGFAPVQ